MFLASTLIAALLQAAPYGSVDTEKEPFQTLEARVSSAIQAKNVAALDELLAKDFAFMAFLEGRAPLVLNRGEWLKTSDHYALVGFEIRHLAARVFGNVAVVRLQPYQVAVAGTTVDRSGEFAIVDVWTRDGGDWRLSSRHLSRPDVLKR